MGFPDRVLFMIDNRLYEVALGGGATRCVLRKVHCKGCSRQSGIQDACYQAAKGLRDDKVTAWHTKEVLADD